MRIVGGELRGSKLTPPKGDKIRPTSDRVRESLFNILAHGSVSFDFSGTRVLDLFAGTGALGIEALSRGARTCVFIDQDVDARGLVRTNIEALGLTGQVKVWRRDAAKLGVAGKGEQFNLIFADPPYGLGMGQKALDAAMSGGWLLEDGVFVLEERKDVEIATPESAELLDRRVYGKAQILMFKKLD